MKKTYFPHFLSSTIELGHVLWKQIITPTDLVIDATCGHGKDTLFLAQCILPQGFLIAIDIQSQAIEHTSLLLQKHLPSEHLSRVEIVHACHSTIAEIAGNRRAKLVIYNLGYLPRHDKTITTKQDTTMKSVLEAMRILTPEGVICITCYPGHAEGQKEEEMLMEFAQTLNPEEWTSMHLRITNRKKAPSILLLSRLY